MRLDPSHSAYLDLLRFAAALSVLFGHMGQDGFEMSWMPLAHLSHSAVIIFFVMSGFIIHVSTVGRSASAADYVIARASRVYSVALPAVVFSVLLSLLVHAWRPEMAQALPGYRELQARDIVASLLFLNESWSSERAGTQLTLNGPYWSLCYEVWYYVLFGLFCFVRGAWRWPAIGAAALIAGPQIVVLFPIWCMGAWLASRMGSLPRLAPGRAWALYLAGPLLIAAIPYFDIDVALRTWLHQAVPGFWRLEGSQRFLTDHLIGVAVATHIYAFTSLPEGYRALFRARQRVFSFLAGFSFTMYLFHRPMTSLAGQILAPEWRGTAGAMLMAVLLVLTCWLLSLPTEAQLPRWRRMISPLVRRRPAAAGPA
jgi:peptidoglycan/LPS O-acetylase OafA/YrhL